jgi:hypothetical protein
MLTLVVTVFALLYLMFTTDDEVVRKEGLFGSVFFETKEVRDGGTGATMGIDNPVAVVVIFGLLAILLAFTQVIFRMLKSYRSQLVDKSQ